MYKRILVPIDGSVTSNRALACAIEMAQTANGRLRIVHVIEEALHLAGYSEYGGYSTELQQAMRDCGNELLTGALAIAKAAGVEADVMLFESFGERLGETVTRAAKLWNADLVVVGTHGRRGIGRVLMGSGAEQIVREAPVPVLVVRSVEEPAAAAEPVKPASAALQPSLSTAP